MLLPLRRATMAAPVRQTSKIAAIRSGIRQVKAFHELECNSEDRIVGQTSGSRRW